MKAVAALLVALALGAACRDRARWCASHAECGPCERCEDGSCAVAVELLNAQGSCEADPDGGARDRTPDTPGVDAASELGPVERAGDDLSTQDATEDSGADCRVRACEGLTYCDTATGSCRPGCGADAQCAEDQRCDLTVHLCTCDTGLYPCAEGCCAWTRERADDGTAYHSGLSCDLALDAQGRPHLLYYALDEDVRYAVMRGSSWTHEHVPLAGGSPYTHDLALAVDAAGTPHAAFFAHQSNDASLLHAVRDGGWVTETLYHGLGSMLGVDLRLDDQGLPHVAFQRSTPDGLGFTQVVGQAWVPEEVELADHLGEAPSLRLDDQGRPWISHVSNWPWSPALRLAHFDGARWQHETLITPADTVRTTALALHGGQPQILYCGHDVGLRRLRPGGDGWQEEDLAPGAEVTDCALALDGAGRARVIFSERASATVRVLFETGETWQASVVEALGGDAGDVAIALDSEGRAHLAYRREPSALVYAY